MRQNSTGTVVTIAIAALVAVLCVGSKTVSVEAAYPVERMKQSFARKVMTRVKGFFNAAEAKAENVRLKREIASLALMAGDVERLEMENARLRRALEYTSKAPEKWLAAGVLSENGGAAGAKKTIRVDKGSIAGVKESAVVVVPEGLVGLVTQVTPHTAEVTLITDPSVKVACEVENQGDLRSRGIIAGGSDDAIVLKHLSNGGEALPRSRVLTSGLGGIFPRGIEVGTLLDVRRDAKGLASEGEVLPNVEYSNLEDVFIRREK